MRSKRLVVLLVGLVGASVHGCGGGKGLGGAAGGAAGSTGSGGTGTGVAGTGVAGASGAAGTSGLAGTSGFAGTLGLAGTSGGAGTGAAGATGAAGLGPLSGAMVEPTPGCGRDPLQQGGPLLPHTIQTMGIKRASCLDSQCGAWSYAREYYLHLPVGYDSHKAYALVIEGPGCGGKGSDLYRNPTLDATAIRVGLSPSFDAQAFHATNPNQFCFDDHDGDDSVEWAFYEALYDRLAGEVCFDRNRVFAAGNSTGARMANELGCKYAGDVLRPVRGVLTRGAGLPVDPKYKPTCTSKPMAGMWVHGVMDQTTPFAETKLALARAMQVNGCTIGTGYDNATFDPFPLGNDSSTCKRVQGCPAAFPLVICPVLISGQTSNDSIVNPGWVAFLKLFEATP